MKKNRLFLALIIALGALLPLSSAYAIDPPDDPPGMRIVTQKAFRNLLESGDFLLVVEYNIPYATPPDVAASTTFLMRFMDGTTQLCGALPTSTGQPYLGYKYGVMSCYFSSGDAPTWQGTYVIRLEANPAVLPTLAAMTYTMTTTDYSTGSTQATNQSQLSNFVLGIANALGPIFGGTYNPLITTGGALGTVLNTAGTQYFTAAIPGLNVMIPSAFQVQPLNLEVVPNPTPTGTPYADILGRNDSVVGEPFNRLAGVFGMGKFAFGFFVVMAISMAIVFKCNQSFGTPTPGIMLSIPIIALSPVFGILSLQVLMVITLFAIIGIGFILFLNRA